MRITPNINPVTVVILLFALLSSSCSVSNHKANKMLSEAKHIQYDVIVVPGVPLENGEWSRVMKARVLWSKYLYDKRIAKNIIFSGAANYTPFVEAEVMAAYAEQLGIPKAHIFLEIKAEHSTENIYYSYKFAKKSGFNTIALASDPFQTKMLMKYTRKKVSKEIGFIPIVFDTLQIVDNSTPDVSIDTALYYLQDFESLHEKFSFSQRFRGTMGKTLDTSAYE